MEHWQQYNRKKLKAEQKIKAGMLLNNSETIAFNGEWFFTVVLPVPVIEQIISIADKYGIKPGQLGALYISNGLSRENK